MNIEDFRDYCLAKAGVTEETPFGPDTLVFKVGGKIFALTNIETFESFNLKCEPIRALQLREEYEAIKPGYHMNKKHWNTVLVNSEVPHSLFIQLIDHSYNLVYAGLSKFEKFKLLDAFYDNTEDIHSIKKGL